MQKQQKSDPAEYAFIGYWDREFPIRFFLENRVEEEGPYTKIPHFHNLFEVAYCHSGAGVYTIAEKIFPFQAGDVVIVNTKEPHNGVFHGGGGLPALIATKDGPGVRLGVEKLRHHGVPGEVCPALHYLGVYGVSGGQK